MKISLNKSPYILKKLNEDFRKIPVIYLVNTKLNEYLSMKIPKECSHNIALFMPCNRGSFKNVLSKAAFQCLRTCLYVCSNIMNISSTDKNDVKSHIIQALVVQQIKFSRSICLMSAHCVFGQYTLLRSLFEAYITMSWLLNSKSTSKINRGRNPFSIYAYNGLYNAKRDIMKMASNPNYGNYERYAVQNRILCKNKKVLKQSGWNEDKITNFLYNISHKKIKRYYKMPNIYERMECISPDIRKNKKNREGIYDVYRTCCNEIHSDFVDIIPKNTEIDDDNKNQYIIRDHSEDPSDVLSVRSNDFLNYISLSWASFILMNSFISLVNKKILRINDKSKLFKKIKQLFKLQIDDLSIINYIGLNPSNINRSFNIGNDKKGGYFYLK